MRIDLTGVSDIEMQDELKKRRNNNIHITLSLMEDPTGGRYIDTNLLGFPNSYKLLDQMYVRVVGDRLEIHTPELLTGGIHITSY